MPARVNSMPAIRNKIRAAAGARCPGPALKTLRNVFKSVVSIPVSAFMKLSRSSLRSTLQCIGLRLGSTFADPGAVYPEESCALWTAAQYGAVYLTFGSSIGPYWVHSW